MSQVPGPVVHRLLALEKRLGIKRSKGASPLPDPRVSFSMLYLSITELTKEMCSSATLAFADRLITRHLPAPQSWRVVHDWSQSSRIVEWKQSSRSATAPVSRYWAKLESQVFVSGHPRRVLFSLEFELSRPSTLQRLCDKVINSLISSRT